MVFILSGTERYAAYGRQQYNHFGAVHSDHRDNIQFDQCFVMWA